MFEFFRQLGNLLSGSGIGFFFVFFLFVTFLWVLKIVVSRRYKPFDNDYRASVSVIIPVVDEPPEVFENVLKRIYCQEPYEIIVVLNGPYNEAIEAITKKYGKFVHLPEPGKRAAIAAGVWIARGQIIALVDSDTLLEDNCLLELVKPFKNSKIGGVTTHQDILNANENLVTRFASWMEKTRAHWSMPAMSVHGTVGCLPGRTIAFRADILRLAMYEFQNEKFLGYHPEISDDRSLTNITLRMGYHTAYQRTARVLTPAPTKLKKFLKQQYRWSRGSQYNTLMMTKWMIMKARFLALLYWAEIMIPFWLISIYLLTFTRVAFGPVPFTSAVLSHLVLALLGSICSLFLRQIWVYADSKLREAAWLPVILLMVTVLMVPVRLLGFMSCGYQIGWGTRKNAIVTKKNKSFKRFVPILLGVSFIGIFYILGNLIWIQNGID